MSGVYPRVGGGAGSMRWPGLRTGPGGLSPRGRGSRWWIALHGSSAAEGLSPRGRGSHHHRYMAGLGMVRGSIPAWAGEPVIAHGLCPLRAGHGGRSIPAWAGEPAIDIAVSALTGFGLSPRGRGRPSLYWSMAAVVQVYPRVGGGASKRRTAPELACHVRSIPAWAGEPNAPSGVRSLDFVRSIPAWAGEPA